MTDPKLKSVAESESTPLPPPPPPPISDASTATPGASDPNEPSRTPEEVSGLGPELGKMSDRGPWLRLDGRLLRSSARAIISLLWWRLRDELDDDGDEPKEKQGPATWRLRFSSSRCDPAIRFRQEKMGALLGGLAGASEDDTADRWRRLWPRCN